MDADQKKEMNEIIEKIAEVALKKREAINSQIEIRNRINVIRSKCLLEIALLKDNKDKPLYATEQLREAALILKLDNDEEYQKLRKELTHLIEESNLASLEHNKLMDQKSLLLLEMGITPSMFNADRNPE